MLICKLGLREIYKLLGTHEANKIVTTVEWSNKIYSINGKMSCARIEISSPNKSSTPVSSIGKTNPLR